MDLNFSNIFEPELLEQISSLPEVEIPKGTVILKEYSYIKEIPLVIDGKIKVRKSDETGKEIILYHIKPGESCILSITSCINDKQSNAEAITEESSTLMIVPSAKVKEWMDTFKSWRKFVMQLYYTRLDSLLQLVDGISFKQTDSRLYEKLQKLQANEGNSIRITHQELANEIGTAREVISRLLKQLEKEGYISLERGIIKIIRPL
ncbi:Crp/Fnr family transcriptional regulator [Carboxylicivirga mesophila]|uniref:Crp/Fnr family transcriptional regulator n=1 Tax=Carboxylicivirga mesophila TaxID=1166478 RepID=A0ABS5K495_9BACT|nr:Crp/Fnr family transcriptional regulator [Carboxylicivirga mesophila]MBS2209839.1 Crp/Fnr family transcriptional regulator [Carboxylicivirga mesophila]